MITNQFSFVYTIAKSLYPYPFKHDFHAAILYTGYVCCILTGVRVLCHPKRWSKMPENDGKHILAFFSSYPCLKMMQIHSIFIKKYMLCIF